MCLSEKEQILIEIVEYEGRVHTLRHNILLMKGQMKGHKERIKELKKRLVNGGEKKKISIYCKNPRCFNHYLANKKIKLTQKDEEKKKCVT